MSCPVSVLERLAETETGIFQKIHIVSNQYHFNTNMFQIMFDRTNQPIHFADYSHDILMCYRF
jgi:hypothetical protein